MSWKYLNLADFGASKQIARIDDIHQLHLGKTILFAYRYEKFRVFHLAAALVELIVARTTRTTFLVILLAAFALLVLVVDVDVSSTFLIIKEAVELRGNKPLD